MRLVMLLSLLLAGCAAAPIQKSSSELFPTASAGISIKDDMKLEKLIDEFSRVTGITAFADSEARVMLQKTTGLNRAVEVPAGEVYSFVESVLVQNELFLTVLHDREPRLFSVRSPKSQRALREAPLIVAAKDIASFGQHPAILVTTVMDLPHVDVRQLANSMRTILTDASTQQIIPVGNSNSLILTGLGSTVASWARMLQEADDTAKRTGDTTQPPPKDKEEKPK